ncbi:hypothetical protein LOK74_17195 [Brevibacillus humidisoli]|uniref:hypothetical protein n=1 Tax=Brevibacillus humidisoli TaxID=2895522 RepID=UPI001E4757FA|nr:hypothetical protein [Brevibacillus humidisoli]UFJ39775.1 hypothetical protein LOK74_17195 [Brevibacillus humidisoli]
MNKFTLILLSLFLFYGCSLESDNVDSQSTSSPGVGYLELDAKLEDAIVNEKKGKGKVKITLNVTKETKADIHLTYSLFEWQDDRYLEPIAEETLFKDHVKVNEHKKINVPFDNLKPAEYMVTLQATSKQNEHITWGASKTIHFTVTEETIKDGWEKRKQKPGRAEYEPNSGSPNIQILDEELPEPPDEDDEKTSANETTSRDQPTTNEQSISTSTDISGVFKYYDENGRSDEVNGAHVKVYDKTKYYTWNFLDSDYTDSYGEWELNDVTIPSDSISSDSLTVYAVLYSLTNSSVDVEDDSSITYRWQTPAVANVYSGSIGTYYIQDDNKRAIWIMHQIDSVYRKLDNYDTSTNVPLRKAYVEWDISTSRVAYFDGYNHTIYLSHDSADNGSSVVMHEAAHSYMWDVYDSWFPSDSCPKPHYITKASNAECAWKEGWADFLPLVIKNDPYFRFPNGSAIDMENTSSFDLGDTVEGRIAGSLWDMYDSNNDGQDTHTYAFSNIYEAMYNSRVANFSDYWYEWLYLANPAIAEDCLNQNSINY